MASTCILQAKLPFSLPAKVTSETVSLSLTPGISKTVIIMIIIIMTQPHLAPTMSPVLFSALYGC